MTVDGSYFNSPFGLGQGQPGGRTVVAPISLESIEQMQVSVAPFDVRQGNFIGGGVNTVTRSGTNQFSASVYHRMRNEDYVGTEAHGTAGEPRHVHVPEHRRLGRRARLSGTSCSCSATTRTRSDKRPLHDLPRQHRAASPSRGNVSRVLASDLDTLSAFLKQTSTTTPAAYRESPRRDAGQALPAADRLQHEQQQQGELPL